MGRNPFSYVWSREDAFGPHLLFFAPSPDHSWRTTKCQISALAAFHESKHGRLTPGQQSCPTNYPFLLSHLTISSILPPYLSSLFFRSPVWFIILLRRLSCTASGRTKVHSIDNRNFAPLSLSSTFLKSPFMSLSSSLELRRCLLVLRQYHVQIQLSALHSLPGLLQRL